MNRAAAAVLCVIFGLAVSAVLDPPVPPPRAPTPAAAPQTALVAPPPGLYTWDVPDRGLRTALVLTVHDGDTMTVGLLVPVVVRLDGINAPELATPTGPASRDALKGLVAGKVVTLDMKGREKYGRTLAVPWLAGPPAVNVSQWMIDGKWAVPWDGKGPRP